MALTNTQLPEPAAVPREAASPPYHRPAECSAPPRGRKVDRAVVIQFIQFCTVGALSTALNAGLFNLFWAGGMGRNGAYVLAFSLAVTSGFLLNRAWTFRHSRAHKMERQYVMFFAVNLVGLALSWVFMTAIGVWLLRAGWAQPLASLVERLTHRPTPVDHLAYTVGLLAATVPCSIWNFTANKLWTFSSSATDDLMT
jgi:putative flippase GtrA